MNASLFRSRCRAGLLSGQEKSFTFARLRWHFQMPESITHFAAFVFASVQFCG